MKNLFYLFILSTALYSCGPDMVDLAIDNPRDEPIIVTIDTLVVEVPGRQVAWVEMGKGPHEIKLENDSVVNYDFTEKAYMLNPSLTSYLKSETFYGDEMYKGTHVSSIPNQKIVYLGMEIEGNFDVVKDLITPVSWDFGPREQLPEMVELEADEPYAAFVKLSDPLEIIQEINAAMESDSTVGVE